MEKLTIDQLKNYLGTGLKIDSIDGSDLYLTPYIIENHLDFGIEPLMYRLSDLDKFIPELGFVPLDKLTPYAQDRFWINKLVDDDLRDWPFQDIQKLCNFHFWIFDQSYFEQGLIIDKLTYK